MGQKCCRPQARLHPKHTQLLNLIYSQTSDNVKIIDHNAIDDFLNKKGYVKVLSDYLSSKLYYINPSLSYCKNKLVSVRNKSDLSKLFYCYLTTQIVQKVASACQQVKLIHSERYANLNKPEQYMQQNAKNIKLTSNIANNLESQRRHVKIKQNINRSRLKQKSKSKRKANSKIANFQGEFFDQQISLNILDIGNQVMKQILNINVTESANKQNGESKIEAIWVKTLFNVQNMIHKSMVQQEKFIKVNYTLIKQVLDNEIYIIGFTCQQSQSSKQTNNFLIPAKNIYNQQLNIQMTTGRHPLKHPILQAKSLQNDQNLKSTSSHQVPSVKLDLNQKYDLMKLSISNYYKVMHKANIHLANNNMSKDIVKVHMPILLECWANLMILKDTDSLHKSSALLNSLKTNNHNQDQKHGKQVTQQKISQIQQQIQLVIQQLFISYFTLRQSQYIYRQLMIIFDKLNFNKLKIVTIQNLVFISLQQHQLHDSVVLKWFDYILQYINIISTVNSPGGSINQNALKSQTPVSTNQNSIFNSNLNSNSFNMGIPVRPVRLRQRNYLADVNNNLFHSSSDRNYQYVNWYKEENIVGCLRTIIRWIKQDLVSIQDIINYKRNKLFFSILLNLAWGSDQISAQVYKLIQILIQNDVRCFGYLMDTGVIFINRLGNSVKVSQEQYDWKYYIDKWKHIKQTFLAQNSIDGQKKIGTKDIEKKYIPKSIYSTLQKSRSNFTYFSFKLRHRVTSLQYDVQLISLQKYLDELICLVSYPFLNRIVQKTSEIVQQQNIYPKKIVKRYSMDENYVRASFAQNNQNQMGSNLQQKNQLIFSSINVQKRIENEQNDKILSFSHIPYETKQKQNNRVSKFQTIEPQKKQINYSLCYNIFEQSLQLLFRDIKIGNDKNSCGHYIKLVGLVLAANFQSMVKLVGRFDPTSSGKQNYNSNIIGQDANAYRTQNSYIKKSLSHIYQLTITANDYLIKLYKQIKLSSIQCLGNQVTSLNSSFDFQRDLQEQRVERIFNLSESFSSFKNNKQKSNGAHNQKYKVGMKYIHTWIYPSIYYILTKKQLAFAEPSAKSRLTENQGQLDDENQNSFWKIDKQNQNQMQILFNICIKVYFLNLLNLVKQNIGWQRTHEKRNHNIGNQNIMIKNEEQNRYRQKQKDKNNKLKYFLKKGDKNKGQIKSEDQNDQISNIELQTNKQSKKFIMPTIQLFNLFLQFHKRWDEVESGGQKSNAKVNGQDFKQDLSKVSKTNKRNTDIQNIVGKNQIHSNLIQNQNASIQLQGGRQIRIIGFQNQQITQLGIQQLVAKIDDSLRDVQKYMDNINQVYLNNHPQINNFSENGVNYKKMQYFNKMEDSKQINVFRESIIEEQIVKSIKDIIYKENFIQTMFIFANNICDKAHSNAQSSIMSGRRRKFKQVDQYLINYFNTQHAGTPDRFMSDRDKLNRQNQQVANNCFSFKKTKNKIMKALGDVELTSEKSDDTIKPQKNNKNWVTSSANNGLYSQQQQYKQQKHSSKVMQLNGDYSLVQIINIIQQKYWTNNQAISMVTRKGKLDFNSGENFQKVEGSVIDTSHLKSQSLQQSFGSVVQQIKKF